MYIHDLVVVFHGNAAYRSSGIPLFSFFSTFYRAIPNLAATGEWQSDPSTPCVLGVRVMPCRRTRCLTRSSVQAMVRAPWDGLGGWDADGGRAA